MPSRSAIMLPDLSPPVLCVSIHDVAPSTWPQCERLLEAVAEVAPLHVSLLLVPDYHGQGDDTPPAYRDAIESCRAGGHELVLHGQVHLDEGPPPRNPLDWWRRRVLTADEGEFATLSAAPAHARLMAGRQWFEQRNWPVEGFVAPAWLLGPGAWRALRVTPFRYTTTATHFHLLQPDLAIRMPVITYSTRSALRRTASLVWQGQRRLPAADPVQLALHPADAQYPAVLGQAQRLLETLIRSRLAMTLQDYARTLEQLLGPLQAARPRSAPALRTAEGRTATRRR